jgi:hypothetical protein
MNQLLQRLQNEEWTVLVSLPRNDVELARAALDGGAQGLKVHINVEHFASGTKFGSFEEEGEELEKIVQAAKEYSVPVGIVPGGTPFAAPEEFQQLAELGIDFFDAYPADAPAWTLQQKHLDVMLAAFHGASAEEMRALEQLGMTMCEASILSHEAYGTPLNTLDLARYRKLADTLKVPFIVPSQKKLLPSDQILLQRAGAQGVLIGTIVTGREAATIEAATRAFCDAV